MKRSGAVVAAVGLILVSFGGQASGYYRYNTSRLKMRPSGQAEVGWVNGPDSPLDTNAQRYNRSPSALDLTVFAHGGEASAYNPLWLTPDDDGATFIAADQVHDLSFDFLNRAGGGYVGKGGPQEALVLTDGTELLLSAARCRIPIDGSTTWDRADFTGSTDPGCSFRDEAGVRYASDGTRTAWEAFVAANPQARVDTGYIEVDTNTHGLRARIDRVRMQDQTQSSLFHMRRMR